MNLPGELLDERNQELWDKLNEKYSVVVTLSDHYKLDFENPNAIVLVDSRKLISLFTHELLHLELRYFGLDSISLFPLTTYNFEEVRIAYNLCNNLEHILMFDEFIDLGFEKGKFVEGLSEKKQLERQIDQYDGLVDQPHFCDPKLYFVSLYFTMKSEQYIGEKREEFLEKLRRKNPNLYKKCMNAYSKIDDIDFDDDLQLQYVEAMADLFTQI